MARVVVTGYPHHVTLVLENPEILRQSKFLILIIDQKEHQDKFCNTALHEND